MAETAKVTKMSREEQLQYAGRPGNVIEALTRVMADLPAIGKDSKAAPQQGGYAYRGIEAITAHTQALFAKHGVVFIPRVVGYEIRDIVVNDKPWTDTIAQVEYDVYGPGGIEDKIVVGPLLSIGRDNSDKGGNKCLTQAFKYALIQALCISDAKDDADAGSPEADAKPATPDAVVHMRGVVRAALASNEVTKEALETATAKLGYPASGDQTAEQLAAVLAEAKSQTEEPL